MTETIAPILSVRDLSVHYGTHTALDSINFSIKPREIIGLIGPNGAGKTSFIRTLCGRIRPAKGTIYVGGNELVFGQDRRQHIGLVPQDIGLYAHLNAYENLEIFGRIAGVKSHALKENMSQALKAVEMEAKAHLPVGHMSGGMKRRINVACALMHRPPLFILDEPTAGVDSPARDTIHRLTHMLARSGAAVLLITHELDQAEALCDKILLLAEGQALAYENPTELLSKCYGATREVSVRFSHPPSQDVLKILAPYHFRQGELATLWKTYTQASEAQFMNSFMISMQQRAHLMREISVRHPGLNNLIHHVECHGALPS